VVITGGGAVGIFLLATVFLLPLAFLVAVLEATAGSFAVATAFLSAGFFAAAAIFVTADAFLTGVAFLGGAAAFLAGALAPDALATAFVGLAAGLVAFVTLLVLEAGAFLAGGVVFFGIAKGL
jgi:hypothetical protein